MLYLIGLLNYLESCFTVLWTSTSLALQTRIKAFIKVDISNIKIVPPHLQVKCVLVSICKPSIRGNLHGIYSEYHIVQSLLHIVMCSHVYLNT